MRTTVGILAVLFFIAFGGEVFGAADTKSNDTQNPDYLVDGLKYRGEGNCEEAVKSYQMARKFKQFKADWIYNLAVADCLVALKRLDEALDSYTKVIEATTNKTLQAEMYRGRATAYYLKAVSINSVDLKTIDLAKKDLDNAINLGADISDLKRTIGVEMEMKPARTDTEEGKSVITGKPVTIIESPNKMIVGDGEYVLYISGDTIIKDQKSMDISASDIKPGDLIDFSFTMSYLSKTDGMTHLSATIITLHRDVTSKSASADLKESPPLPDVTQMLILSKLNMLTDEIRDLKERLLAATKKPAKPKTKKKSPRKGPAAGKEQPKKTEMQGEIK
jgi:tetratricopeptide (TPR) repeat protein